MTTKQILKLNEVIGLIKNGVSYYQIEKDKIASKTFIKKVKSNINEYKSYSSLLNTKIYFAEDICIERQIFNYLTWVKTNVDCTGGIKWNLILKASGLNETPKKASENFKNNEAYLFLVDLKNIEVFNKSIELLNKLYSIKLVRKRIGLKRKSKKRCIFNNSVYRFIDQNCNTIYIGKALNLNTRLNSHKYNGHLPEDCYNNVCKIEYIELQSSDDMDLVERLLIAKHKPMFNTEFVDKNFTVIDMSMDDFEWRISDFELLKTKEEI